MTKRHSAAAVALPTKQLSAAELNESARNLSALRKHNASWKVGDQRDAEVDCACGTAKVAILVAKDERGLHWETRCLRCRPVESTNCPLDLGRKP